MDWMLNILHLLLRTLGLIAFPRNSFNNDNLIGPFLANFDLQIVLVSLTFSIHIIALYLLNSALHNNNILCVGLRFMRKHAGIGNFGESL